MENETSELQTHEELRAEFEAAWEATGVAGCVRGMVTLDEVVRVNRQSLSEMAMELKVARARLAEVETWARSICEPEAPLLPASPSPVETLAIASACDCHLHEHQVCDVCQGLVAVVHDTVETLAIGPEVGTLPVDGSPDATVS